MAEPITKEQTEELIAAALAKLKAEQEAEEKGVPAPVTPGIEMKEPTKVAAVDAQDAVGKETRFPAIHAKPKGSDDLKQFQISKAVLGIVTGNWEGRELERDWIKESSNSSVYKALGLIPDTAGGFLVPEELSAELIGQLSARTVFRAAGAQVIPNAPLTLRIPRQTQGTTAYWVGDSPLSSAITDSDVAFGMLTLQPRRVAARTVLDEDLIAYSAIPAESIVRADITQQIGLAEDLAYYSGTGGTQPLGLLSQPGVTVTNVATASLSFDSLLDLMAAIDAANGTYNAWIMHPTTMQTIRKWKSGAGQFQYIVDLAAAPRNQLLGLPVYMSTQISTAHIILGNFQNYVIADSGPLAIKVLRERYADQLQIGIVASHRTDGAPRQAAEFRIINIT